MKIVHACLIAVGVGLFTFAQSGHAQADNPLWKAVDPYLGSYSTKGQMGASILSCQKRDGSTWMGGRGSDGSFANVMISDKKWNGNDYVASIEIEYVVETVKHTIKGTLQRVVWGMNSGMKVVVSQFDDQKFQNPASFDQDSYGMPQLPVYLEGNRLVIFLMPNTPDIVTRALGKEGYCGRVGERLVLDAIRIN